MQLRDLQALRAVVMSGTTKGAALALGVSQPTISRSIAQVEAHFGRNVFTRHRGRLIPTAYATKISESVKAIDDMLLTLKDDVASGDRTRSLRVGISSDCSGEPLRRTIRQFTLMYPEVTIQVETADKPAFGPAIANGMLDLGICDDPTTFDGVIADLIFQCDLSCLLPRDHPLCTLDQIGPENLIGETMIGVREDSLTARTIARAFANANVECNRKLFVSSARLACDFVAQGLGVAITTPLPTLAGSFHGRVEVRPFKPAINWKLFSLVATESNSQQVARQFCRVFRRAARPTPDQDCLAAPSLAAARFIERTQASACAGEAARG